MGDRLLVVLLSAGLALMMLAAIYVASTMPPSSHMMLPTSRASARLLLRALSKPIFRRNQGHAVRVVTFVQVPPTSGHGPLASSASSTAQIWQRAQQNLEQVGELVASVQWFHPEWDISVFILLEEPKEQKEQKEPEEVQRSLPGHRIGSCAKDIGSWAAATAAQWQSVTARVLPVSAAQANLGDLRRFVVLAKQATRHGWPATAAATVAAGDDVPLLFIDPAHRLTSRLDDAERALRRDGTYVASRHEVDAAPGCYWPAAPLLGLYPRLVLAAEAARDPGMDRTASKRRGSKAAPVAGASSGTTEVGPRGQARKAASVAEVVELCLFTAGEEPAGKMLVEHACSASRWSIVAGALGCHNETTRDGLLVQCGDQSQSNGDVNNDGDLSVPQFPTRTTDGAYKPGSSLASALSLPAPPHCVRIRPRDSGDDVRDVESGGQGSISDQDKSSSDSSDSSGEDDSDGTSQQSPPRCQTLAAAAATTSEEDDPLTVALLVPATTKGLQMPLTSLDQVALVKHLLPTLVEQAWCDARAPDPPPAAAIAAGAPASSPGDHLVFRFVVYVGFDEGDAFYDNAASRQSVRAALSQLLWSNPAFRGQGQDQGQSSPPVEIKFVRARGMAGAPVWIWNLLAKEAFFSGADYLYQVNDDLRLMSPCWARALAFRLRSSPCPNLGVVGPVDSNNRRIMTQAFVHRTHVEIFGSLFPPAFKNWFSDDWMTRVYGFRQTFQEGSVVVLNVQDSGTRYKEEHQAEAWLQEELDRGKRSIQGWLNGEDRAQPLL